MESGDTFEQTGVPDGVTNASDSGSNESAEDNTAPGPGGGQIQEASHTEEGADSGVLSTAQPSKGVEPESLIEGDLDTISEDNIISDIADDDLSTKQDNVENTDTSDTAGTETEEASGDQDKTEIEKNADEPSATEISESHETAAGECGSINESEDINSPEQTENMDCDTISAQEQVLEVNIAEDIATPDDYLDKSTDSVKKVDEEEINEDALLKDDCEQTVAEVDSSSFGDFEKQCESAIDDEINEEESLQTQETSGFQSVDNAGTENTTLEEEEKEPECMETDEASVADEGVVEASSGDTNVAEDENVAMEIGDDGLDSAAIQQDMEELPDTEGFSNSLGVDEKSNSQDPQVEEEGELHAIETEKSVESTTDVSASSKDVQHDPSVTVTVENEVDDMLDVNEEEIESKETCMKEEDQQSSEAVKVEETEFNFENTDLESLDIKTDEMKPEDNKEEMKPEDNKEEMKPEDNKEEMKPGDSKEEMKPEEMRPEDNKEEMKPQDTGEEMKTEDQKDEVPEEFKEQEQLSVENKTEDMKQVHPPQVDEDAEMTEPPSMVDNSPEREKRLCRPRKPQKKHCCGVCGKEARRARLMAHIRKFHLDFDQASAIEEISGDSETTSSQPEAEVSSAPTDTTSQKEAPSVPSIDLTEDDDKAADSSGTTATDPSKKENDTEEPERVKEAKEACSTVQAKHASDHVKATDKKVAKANEKDKFVEPAQPKRELPKRELRSSERKAANATSNTKQAAPSKPDEDDDVIAIKEEKKPKPKTTSKIQTCIVCAKVGKCKYNIVRNGDVKHLCDDACFKRFRSSPTTFLRQAEAKGPLKNGTQSNNAVAQQKPKTPPVTAAPPSKPPAAQPSQGGQIYKTCHVCQLMNLRTSKPFLNWQGLDFCGEECLGKFQSALSVTCSYCTSQIHQTNKAKFCWRVGDAVKHFCSQSCNNEFVKRLKVCTFCNKDLATVGDSFMAPVGNHGMFKDFCSQTCLQKFEDKNSKDMGVIGVHKGQKTQTAPKGNYYCAVCSKIGPVKHELILDGKVNRLCSDPCYSAFQYANKLTLNTCDNCGTSCYNEGQTPQYVQFEGQQKRFCSFMCVTTFRTSNKKIVPCAWCSAKKNNFDMIERVDAKNKYQLFCSLNCLSLYRVNLQATSNQAVVCDQCRKFVPAQYHLTMSDASVRNFCSYGCVMQFQAQFQAPAKGAAQNKQAPPPPSQPTQQQQQQTTTRSGRMVTRGVTAQKNTPAPPPPPPQPPKTLPAPSKPNTRGSKSSTDSFPIISDVVSLAPQGNQQQINIKSSSGVIVTGQQQGIKTTTTTTGNQTVQQQIIIQPPPPKSVKNKSLICKPFVQTKATSCRPHTQTKETQTDGKTEPDKYLIPVPVPVYCPTPLAMYSTPTPILVPVPVPIPVPVFIPTTQKSSSSILKQIKEIQEKIPADPLEAELLMMAEAVAEKESESGSDTEDGEPAEAVADQPMPDETPSAEVSTKEVVAAPGAGGELGEDMLQMALRMASEMSEEPVMDLENSLEPVAVSTVPPPQAPIIKEPEEEEEYTAPSVRQTRRSRGGNKRASRSTPRRTPKRQRVEAQPNYNEPTPSPPPPQAPPPDANFHLKYTYGVNAFKHWVMQKNVQLEQAPKPGFGKALKTYKSDILQCTADELNFSLCMFVKEVRKPNGEEYAVDSIFYLCLGIQQYLFENGRIDNIFTDVYYERFTECLNELLTRYEPKLNHSGQLVCRIEEEHLWESKQLGAHSPHVLLNSLVYFNTKYFMLKTSEDHLKLSFTHIMKHWKKAANGRGSGTGANAGRSVYLRYYCPAPQGKDSNVQKQKKKEDMPVYEQTENLDNPLRCPVKLYEFYLSKCPESIKNRNDTFYLVPERSCVPDSPVWYSTAMLGVDAMAKMLNRIRLVREIQEAHLHTQPIYI